MFVKTMLKITPNFSFMLISSPFFNMKKYFCYLKESMYYRCRTNIQKKCHKFFRKFFNSMAPQQKIAKINKYICLREFTINFTQHFAFVNNPSSLFP